MRNRKDLKIVSLCVIWEISRYQFDYHFVYSCHTDMNELYP